ncbi:hypothetical protein [Streptomyces sp. NPDC050428]|uniref:hypothetical protein n=1 Tax=Streptomyces sp. NPDC050428 TaxID=3155757 RepID=UPI003442A0CC
MLNGLSEALAVQPGGFAVCTGLVDTPAAVGNDQGETSAPAPATTPKESFTRSKSVFASSFAVLSISLKSRSTTKLTKTQPATRTAAAKVRASARPTLHNRNSRSFGDRDLRLDVMTMKTRR